MEDKTNLDFKNIIGSLPEEIIEEILKRLPVKSLNRFRCVSKSWLSLILSPQFIKKHFNYSGNNPRIMFTNIRNHQTPYHNRTYELKHISLHSFLEHKTVASEIDFPWKDPCMNDQVVVGSCNGIICLIIDESHIFLWNPSMRTSKKLPPLSVKINPEECGFGFHKCGDDYKVVAIRKRSRVDELKTYIYSRNADSWKKVKGDRPGFFLGDNLGFYASRKFHFMIRPDWDAADEKIIISVDSTDGMFGVVEEPNYGNCVVDNSLGVLGGSLCVFSNNWDSCDVWVMKEYNVKESWTKLFSFPLYFKGYNRRVQQPLFSEPLVMLPNGEVLVVWGNLFVVYNPKDDRVKWRPQIVTNLPGCFTAATLHVESLVTL